MVMHKYFANWYSVANPEPKSEVLNNRWAAIENLVEPMTKPFAFDLVRLFYDRPVKDEGSIEKFRKAFQDVDSAFLMRGNDLELRVLAGTTLVNIMDQEPADLTDATALAIECGAYQELRPQILLPDILTYARSYLKKEGVRVREPHRVLDISKIAPVTKDMVKTLTAAITDDTLSTSPEALTSPLEKVSAALGKLVEATNQVTASLDSNSRIQLEETNILWWLFGEYSRDQTLHMGEVGFPGASLVVGKELADLTVLLPGPRGAIAYLDKMLRTAKAALPQSIKLLDAVNNTQKEWRSEWVNSRDFQIVDDLCPVHLATARSVEISGKSTWVASFESATGLKAGKVIPPLHLSLQTYEEALLIRAAS